MKTNRRGKAGQIQQEIYDALLPVLEKWSKKHGRTKDQFFGLVQSSVDDVVFRVRKKP